MSDYILILTIIGLAALGMAWMPAISEKIRVSYSVIYVLLGVVLYAVFDFLPDPQPKKHEVYTMHFTEMVVIVSLMGTGLKIDQRFSFKSWRIPFRLIFITMLLAMGIVTVLGWWAFDMEWASALLLAAVLSPTDPVLASDVQVGPPNEDEKDNVRFSLTAEAGLNDGMAFPFVWLAIVLSIIAAGQGEASVMNWFWNDLLYRIAAGVGCGFLLGRIIAYLLFSLPEKRKFLLTRDGFVAISATLLVYGLTELIHGYGFIAVFVAALTLRDYERDHKYHKKLHDFTDQIERILLAIILILFGGSLVSGILDKLTWQMALFGVAFIFVIRPLTAYIALSGLGLHSKEKLAISFFGIRGIGSFFYLSFAVNEAYFKKTDELWAITAFIVLISIIIHGITAAFSLRKLDEQLPDNKEVIAGG